MQENLFTQINDDMRAFNARLDSKLTALENEIAYLKRLRQLVHSAYARDNPLVAAQAATSGPSGLKEIEAEMQKLAQKYAAEKSQ